MINLLMHSEINLLDRLVSKGFDWFKDKCHPKTGMVKDRSSNYKRRISDTDDNRMSSIASTGYHLTILPYAVRCGWVTKEHASQTTIRTLRFVLEHLDHYNGLLYHFVDWETGERWEKCEYSLLDTAIFLNGCMVASEAFNEAKALSDAILDRVEWSRFLTLHPISKKSLLSLGWLPNNSNLLPPADVRSSEFFMAYLLAVGSRTHPIEAQVWYNTEVITDNVCGYHILNPSHALFTSYYGMGWADLRGKVDAQGVDFNDNARLTALANREYCYFLSKTFITYKYDKGGWWGLSAGDSITGYVARGPMEGDPYGTVWPMASLATINWISDVLLSDVSRWKASDIWSKVEGDYGLSPFSLNPFWVGLDVIGIDLGSFIINWINYKDESVWKLWMRHPIAINALQRLGYSEL